MALLAVPARAGDDPDIVTGELFVTTNCAGCHAVGRTDDSVHPEAPPFRLLSSRYPVETLQEALAEGIVVGHPDMPVFVATPEEIAALIVYLESIQD